MADVIVLVLMRVNIDRVGPPPDMPIRAYAPEDEQRAKDDVALLEAGESSYYKFELRTVKVVGNAATQED